MCLDSGPVGVGRMELQLPGLSTSLYREGSAAPSTGLKNRVLVAQNVLHGRLQAPGSGLPPYSLPCRKGWLACGEESLLLSSWSFRPLLP